MKIPKMLVKGQRFTVISFGGSHFVSLTLSDLGFPQGYDFISGADILAAAVGEGVLPVSDPADLALILKELPYQNDINVLTSGGSCWCFLASKAILHDVVVFANAPDRPACTFVFYVPQEILDC